MTHSYWIPRFLAMVVLLLCIPATGLSEGACGCEDLCNLAKKLKEKERLLEAARKVAEEAKEKWFPTAGWAKERFLEIAFPSGNYKVEGEQQFGEEVKVSDELKKGNCDSLWKSTEAHEKDHAEFDKTVPNWKYPWIMIFGQEGEFLSRKEVSGYLAAVEYLRKEIEKLSQNCPPVDCNPEPPSKPLVLETYQRDNAVAQAEQKQRLEGSTRRVKGYAESIR